MCRCFSSRVSVVSMESCPARATMVYRLGDLAERLGVRVSVAGDDGDDPLHEPAPSAGGKPRGGYFPRYAFAGLISGRSVSALFSTPAAPCSSSGPSPCRRPLRGYRPAKRLAGTT